MSDDSLERHAQEYLDGGRWPFPGSVLDEYMTEHWPAQKPPQCGHESGVLVPRGAPGEDGFPWPPEATAFTCVLEPGHQTWHQSKSGWRWGNEGQPTFFLA